MAKEEILNPKVHATGIIDVLGLGIAKQATERIATPYIGNGTVKSGAMKGVAGGLLYGRAGRIGNMVAGGMLVDAAEDLVVSLMSNKKADTTSGADW